MNYPSTRVWKRFGLMASVIGLEFSLLICVVVDSAHAAGSNKCTAIQHRGHYQGTENQPKGVTHAEPYGFVEIDANMTSDNQLAATHDFDMSRITGGAYDGNINDISWDDLQALDSNWPVGRVRHTEALIDRAAKLDTRIWVNVNKGGEYFESGQLASMIDQLWDAAQEHPHPEKVMFGGAINTMRNRHPGAVVFERYENLMPREDILADIEARDIDWAAFHSAHFDAAFIQQVKDAGARVATRQVEGKGETRVAQRAGINVVQGNRARIIARKWCQ